MSGLSGLSNHCRERSFLIWATVGFFALAIGVSSDDLVGPLWFALNAGVPKLELGSRTLLDRTGCAKPAPASGDYGLQPCRDGGANRLRMPLPAPRQWLIGSETRTEGAL